MQEGEPGPVVRAALARRLEVGWNPGTKSAGRLRAGWGSPASIIYKYVPEVTAERQAAALPPGPEDAI